MSPAGMCDQKAAEGWPHSKTWRIFPDYLPRGSVLECGQSSAALAFTSATASLRSISGLEFAAGALTRSGKAVLQHPRPFYPLKSIAATCSQWHPPRYLLLLDRDFLPPGGGAASFASTFFFKSSSSFRNARLVFCRSSTSCRRFLKSSAGLRSARSVSTARSATLPCGVSFELIVNF